VTRVTNPAARRKGYGLPLADLIAEANLGLVIAASRFEPDHLTMAQLLAVLLARLPEWPPIEHDEKKIRAALQVLIPEPEWSARLSQGHRDRTDAD
jgi:hypothetical protein